LSQNSCTNIISLKQYYVLPIDSIQSGRINQTKKLNLLINS